jgi:hypothetical protein
MHVLHYRTREIADSLTGVRICTVAMAVTCNCDTVYAFCDVDDADQRHWKPLSIAAKTRT